MSATIVDWSALWQAVWTAAVAGIAVTLVFALAVLGTTRTQDARRTRGGLTATMFGALAVVCGIATIVIVVFAVTVITTK